MLNVECLHTLLANSLPVVLSQHLGNVEFNMNSWRQGTTTKWQGLKTKWPQELEITFIIDPAALAEIRHQSLVIVRVRVGGTGQIAFHHFR